MYEPSGSCVQNRTVDAKHSSIVDPATQFLHPMGVCGQVLGLLVPVSCTPCGASTSGLSTRWSGRGPYPVDPVRDLILKRASRLDAFSGYPCRSEEHTSEIQSR